LSHIYDNKIGNNVFLAGDSHANWVSDLAWLGEKPYDQKTGEGAVGVEFGGTAVSSTGYGGEEIAKGNKKAAVLVKDNQELQWAEGYYRGYYELFVTPESVSARYYGKSCLKRMTHPDLVSNTYIGCPTVATRNPLEISLANFTVNAGDNHLQRSIANGTVEAGALQRGTVKQTNMTLNTEDGTWNITKINGMYIKY
jgi:alkaline phosphatase D